MADFYNLKMLLKKSKVLLLAFKKILRDSSMWHSRYFCSGIANFCADSMSPSLWQVVPLSWCFRDLRGLEEPLYGGTEWTVRPCLPGEYAWCESDLSMGLKNPQLTLHIVLSPHALCRKRHMCLPPKKSTHPAGLWVKYSQNCFKAEAILNHPQIMKGWTFHVLLCGLCCIALLMAELLTDWTASVMVYLLCNCSGEN